ncbi:MAG: type II toxin-antitoxin system ParD family antitoxin [Candidatus Parcubacteria bacterium]|nr:type II toxin-antitoxin system ParD family antitoxin [Candidatus Parcubacteria bacterium]
MSTLSVPLNPALEEFIDSFVKKGRASNKAEVVRQALRLLAEDEAVSDVLKAQQEIHAGKAMRGDIRELSQQLG